MQGNSNRGFTIVELLVTIVIIGILAAITIVAYTGIQTRAVAASLQSDVSNASQQLKLFQISNGNFPTTIDCAQADSATNKCLKSSPGTSYVYQFNNSSTSQVFCISVTKNNQVYKATQDDKPSTGDCLLSSGLILHFDATTSASYSGTGSKWSDLSGYGNNGTIAGGVTYDSNNGGSLVFDGSGTVSLSGLLNQAPASQEWTVSSVVKLVSTTPTANSQQLINFNSGLYLALPSTDKLLLYLNSGTDDYYDYGNFNLKDNSWHIISFVFQNSSGKREIYVDNVDVSTTGPNKTSTPSGLPGTFTIGNGVIGRISDVNVYNRALSTAEVQQNFNALRSRYGL